MFQSNLPLCWAAGRAVIWDKLGSLCRAECRAFLKSWVNIKHKRKYLSESSELPLSLSLCLQTSSNEVIRESGSVQPLLLHVTMVLSNHLPPFIQRGWVPLVCPPRAHTGGGGRQKSHKVCPTYLFTQSWQAPALRINPSKQLEKRWLNARPDGSTRAEGWRARGSEKVSDTSDMRWIFMSSPCTYVRKSYSFLQFNHSITGIMQIKLNYVIIYWRAVEEISPSLL